MDEKKIDAAYDACREIFKDMMWGEMLVVLEMLRMRVYAGYTKNEIKLEKIVKDIKEKKP